MDSLLNWLAFNPTGSLILLISFGVVSITVTVLFVVAYMQGREIIFWPPTIGVREAAEKALTSGEGEVVTVAEKGDTKGDSVKGENMSVDNNVVIGATNKVLSYDKAYERVIGSTTFVLSQLEISYTQTREQSQSWFRFSLVAAIIGFILVAAGVLAVILGQVTAGVITAISSIIPNAAAALFFAQSRTANKRVDAIQTKLAEAREFLTAVEITNTIEETKARDKLKTEIVRKALRIDAKGKTN